MATSSEIAAPWEPIVRASRDLRDSATTLELREARYLVDLYYTVQKYRMRAREQQRSAAKHGEPHALVSWTFDCFISVERDLERAMDVYSDTRLPGVWAKSIHGIAAVIASGLLAHIEIEPWKCPNATAKRAPCPPDKPCTDRCGRILINTAGKVWRFAGMDDPDNYEWKPNTKRPWNARLKKLMWAIGYSFMSHRHNEKDIYGAVYDHRKKLEVERNECGLNREAAAKSLKERNIRDDKLRKVLESGKLPDGQIEFRARRPAIKLFLAHYHHVAYEDHFKRPPPFPYVIEHLGHADYLKPPHWENGQIVLPEKQTKAGECTDKGE